MNLLIITGIFPPDIGGPASYVPAVAESLVRRGHTISVITLSDSVQYNDAAFGFPVLRLLRSIPCLLRVIKTIATIIRKGTKADILFVNGLALEAVLANFFLKKPLVQKVVGDLAWERACTFSHIQDRIEDFQKNHYGFKIELLKKLRSFWVKKSDAVITPSKYLKSIVAGWGVPEEKIQIIYNAVTGEEPTPADSPVINLLKRIGDKKKIVSAGRLVPWKGFAELIKSMESFPEAHLIIVGEGLERQHLESLIQKNLQEHVHLAGSLSRSELFAVLKDAYMFVLNSTYEGFPHMVLENNLTGTTVVATSVGGTRELIQDGYNGLLIAPDDPIALKDAIQRLFEDPELNAALARNAKENLKNFSWQSLVNQTEALFVKTCMEKKQGLIKSHPRISSPVPVLFLSTARYGNPPDPTLQKKWRGLAPFLQSTVISFGDNSSPSRISFEGSHCILLPSRLPRLLRYILYFITSFWLSLYGALRKKYLAIIAQSPYEAVAPALALMPWKLFRSTLKPKLIVEVHSDWRTGTMLYHHNAWFAWLEKPLRLFVGKLSLSQADAYRVISEYCRGLVPSGQKPVYVFSTFTDLESFKEPSPESLQAVTETIRNKFFIYAGMLIYLKGIHLLIQAFQEVATHYPDVQLIIAGKGSEERDLKMQAEKLGIAEKVLFVGHLEQKILAAYIKNSLALILPSLTEGLGRVVIEAQFLGRPVIASCTGGIPEIIINNKTGILIEPGDIRSLTEAMKLLLENPVLVNEMGRSGREQIVEKYNYQHYFEAYHTMVQQVCYGQVV